MCCCAAGPVASEQIPPPSSEFSISIAVSVSVSVSTYQRIAVSRQISWSRFDAVSVSVMRYPGNIALPLSISPTQSHHSVYKFPISSHGPPWIPLISSSSIIRTHLSEVAAASTDCYISKMSLAILLNMSRVLVGAASSFIMSACGGCFKA
jgi:hypothetical protein